MIFETFNIFSRHYMYNISCSSCLSQTPDHCAIAIMCIHVLISLSTEVTLYLQHKDRNKAVRQPHVYKCIMNINNHKRIVQRVELVVYQSFAVGDYARFFEMKDEVIEKVRTPPEIYPACPLVVSAPSVDQRT